jgi:hypothetical protein
VGGGCQKAFGPYWTPANSTPRPLPQANAKSGDLATTWKKGERKSKAKERMFGL